MDELRYQVVESELELSETQVERGESRKDNSKQTVQSVICWFQPIPWSYMTPQ
jgi:hypothetical protein